MNYNVFIELLYVEKKFEDDFIVNDLSFKIYENEFVILFGLFGCGKIIIFCMIGGFEKFDKGYIIINGKIFNDLLFYVRLINIVF